MQALYLIDRNERHHQKILWPVATRYQVLFLILSFFPVSANAQLLFPHVLSSEDTFPFSVPKANPPQLSVESNTDSTTATLSYITSSDDRRPPIAGISAYANEKAIVLRGSVLDQRSAEMLDRIVIEVFVLDERGEMQRAYAGNALTGRLSLPLARGMSHILLLRKAGYESRAVFVEGSHVDLSKTFLLVSRDDFSEDVLVARGVAPGYITPLPALSLPKKLIAAQPRNTSIVPYIRVPRHLAPGSSQEREVEAYRLTAATSFREAATHRSAVLLRFQPGDRVEVLEKNEPYWWRVQFRGKTGYAKALLLEPAGKK